MPYTISHTAAVLPFSRWLAPRRLLSAAVIGAMIPDLGYLLPWHLPRALTHTAVALLTFCLPSGLACYWIFQLLIKRAVIEALPDGAYWRARPYLAAARLGRPGHWLRASLGILIGALSHVSWDAFTHEGARGVRMFPALNDDLGNVGGHHLLIYKLLQQGSSILGLTIVFWVVWRALRSPAPSPRPDRTLGTTEREAWFIAYPATAALATLVALAVAHLKGGEGSMQILYVVAIAVLRALAFSAIAVSAALRLRLRTARR
ncbi:MAG: DUF4184 family protein [Steroidobacteraceae bacterium]|nr:DUF4184 family protein [Steroidobacteraceae bacterium]